MIAGVYELYEQLLPTLVYQAKKTRTGPSDRTLGRLCGKASETVAHILAGCPALAQSKYLQRLVGSSASASYSDNLVFTG